MVKVFPCLVVLACFCGLTPAPLSSVTVTNLRCEYLVNPAVIDAFRPRLSWELTSTAKGKFQRAYQILVAGDPSLLSEAGADLWNSGRVTGAGNVVAYAGMPLASGQPCYWKVRIWDEKGRVSAWSPVSRWAMGLLRPADWKAQWIGAAADTTTDLYPSYLHNGFHSEFADSARSAKWVTVDLGRDRHIDEIRLFPTHPSRKEAGYLFPVRFRLEVSGRADFSDFQTVAGETTSDIPNPGDHPWRAKVAVKGRYIRVWVTKLAPAGGRYAFALAELQAVSSGKNLALHAAVSASDMISQGEGGWDADRLTDGYTRSSVIPPPLPGPPSPLLRKTFAVHGRIKRATLYITALGLYRAYLNGEPAGEQVLAPEWTDYRKRVQYQVYDVTKLLHAGKNTLGAMLADGWYVGPLMTSPRRGVYGINRRLMARLQIENADGGTKSVVTDGSWDIFLDGPVRSASIYDGQTTDDRKWPRGWNTPGDESGAGWQPVTVDTTVHLQLSAQIDEPVKVIRTIRPVGITRDRDGNYIVDMGQNMVGWCRLRAPGYRGQQIVLRYGEMLKGDGSLYTANLRGAAQTDSFIARPGPAEFAPSFTYHGFRYVEITGLDAAPEPGQLTGEVVSTSNAPAGSFSCSDTLLNRLWNNISWTQIGNTVGVPTDCPQRDERMGWMGDAQAFSPTAIFNRDMAAFYIKWMGDIRDGQLPDGQLSDFAPQLRTARAFYNSPAWADAAVIIPWHAYVNYGDKRILEAQYETLGKYNDHIAEVNPDFLWSHDNGYNYGDWLNGDDIAAKDYPRTGGRIDGVAFATAFYAYSTRILSKIAGVLDKEKDSLRYAALADSIGGAFRRHFVEADGALAGNTQAGYALALRFNLLPDSLRQAALEKMIAGISVYGNRMSTGIQSSIRMMEELARSGHADLAYTLLESHRLPSWLYSVDQGATTIWERWDGFVKGRGFQNPGMNSFNHYAFGAIGQWMYHHIGGIQPDEGHPGYRHFILHPLPGGGLSWARASYHSMQGLIVSNWRVDGKKFSLHVEIPVNTTAEVYVPVTQGEQAAEAHVRFLRQEKSCAVYLVPSGEYDFEGALP